MIIEVNGVKYAQKEQNVPQRGRGASAHLQMIAAMSMMASMYGMNNSTSRNGKPEKTVDIVKEFELIQRKQSKLSRAERDWVVRQFNKLYTKIP